MSKTSFYCLTLALCFLSNVSYAKKSIDECELTQKTTSGLSGCLDIVKQAVDRELQTWINFRENDCRWQYLAISPGTGAASAYKKCYILVSQSRIKELESINP